MEMNLFEIAMFGGGSNGSTAVSGVSGNSIVTKSDGIYGATKPYTYIKQLEDYLYEIQFTTENIDQEYCYNYFSNPNSDSLNTGACTGFYYNGKVLRHYDWYYDDTVEFLVRRAPDVECGKYASIGIAAMIPFFTKELVGSNLYYDKYKLIPFATCDGVNEKGMYIQSNVTPRKKSGGQPVSVHVTHTCSQADYKGAITYNMINRIVLDNCATVEEAKTELTKYDIYRPARMTDCYDMHYLLGDTENNHCVLEFTSDGTGLSFINNCGDDVVGNTVPYHAEIMTNFNCGVGISGDGLFTLDYNEISADNASSIGLERWEICSEALGESVGDNPVSINFEYLREELMYTNLYDITTDPYWYTEYSGMTTEYDEQQITLTPDMAKSNILAFDTVKQQAITDYENRYRGDELNWQTVHSVIYNLNNKSMNLVVQERKIDGVAYDSKTYFLNEYNRGYASPFPEDMWGDFNTTVDFCNYFAENHSDIAVPGASFMGSGLCANDFPSADHGGELILNVVSNRFYILDFYSDNTAPYHWYTIFEGTGLCGGLGGWMDSNTALKFITGYNAAKTQVLKNVNGTFQWVDET